MEYIRVSHIVYSIEKMQAIVTENAKSVLMIVNHRTIHDSVSKDLKDIRKDGEVSLNILYIARPSLVSEGKSSRQVDFEFDNKLLRGRSELERITREAKSLGLEPKTSFEWADSVSNIKRKYDGTVDHIIDETR